MIKLQSQTHAIRQAFLWVLAAGFCPEYNFFRYILQFIQ